MGGYRLTAGDFQARFDPLGRLTHLGNPDEIKLKPSPFHLQGEIREGHWTVNCGGGDIFFDPENTQREYDLQRQRLKLLSSWRGPCAWYGLDLERIYSIEKGLLRCDFKISTFGTKGQAGDVIIAAPIQRLRYTTGINCWTDYSSDWDHRPYPTNMRCEKEFFWGLSISPAHDLVGFFTLTKADSWHVIYEGDGSQRIRSWCIDFINSLDLHPVRLTHQNIVLNSRNPSYCGTFYAGIFESEKEFFRKVSEILGTAFIMPDRCAGFAGEHLKIPVVGPKARVEVFDEKSGKRKMELKPTKGYIEIKLDNGFGRDVLRVKGDSKETEARIWHQEGWEKPLITAARYACDVKKAHGYNAESILGLITISQAAGFLGDKYCATKARQVLKEAYTLIYDRKTGRHKPMHNRLQNYGSLLDAIRIFQKHLNTDEFLREGIKSARQLMSLQGADGNFYNHHVIYNNVVHPVKSLFDWGEHIRKMGYVFEANRIKESVGKAYANLVKYAEDTQTEGSDHFEDGMTSCCAYQIAGLWPYFGRKPEDLAKAVNIAAKRRALTCRVPDSRFFNSTLRHWEGYWALGLGQCMLGGHGWNCWAASMFHALFQACVEWDYIINCYSTIANCLQSVDLEKRIFYFGFAIDPCWRDYVGLGRQYRGEEYVEIPDEIKVSTEQHQVFLSLEDSFFRETYVKIDGDGIEVLNGKIVKRSPDTIYIKSYALNPERLLISAKTDASIPRIKLVNGTKNVTVRLMCW